MNKHMLIKFMALAFVGSFQIADAAIPNLSVKLPGNTSVYTSSVGAVFNADIYIDSVDDFALFDFNLSFNSAKLEALSLTSASVFGAADTETFFNAITPGKVHFAETISGTSALASGINIAAPTLLGTIQFKALSSCINNFINFTNPIIATWDSTSLAGSALPANVTISPAAAVPLPASVFLFLPGLFAVFAGRKHKTRPLIS